MAFGGARSETGYQGQHLSGHAPGLGGIWGPDEDRGVPSRARWKNRGGNRAVDTGTPGPARGAPVGPSEIRREDQRMVRKSQSSGYLVCLTQYSSNASVRDWAISWASLFSIWWRWSMKTGLPSRKIATEGDDGG